MKLIQDVDKPGSNVESYISDLDTMLLSSISKINMLRKQMKTFERHLKQEEQLSQKFYEQQQDEDMQFQDDQDYEQHHDPMNDEFMDDMKDLH
jgi:kinesin family protein 2/24